MNTVYVSYYRILFWFFIQLYNRLLLIDSRIELVDGEESCIPCPLPSLNWPCNSWIHRHSGSGGVYDFGFCTPQV